MDVLWLKALHVAAVLLFTGGLLAQSLMVSAALKDRVAHSLLARLQRWDRRVTVPALLVVWTLGIAAALRGGWFGAGWLSAKLVFVMALTGLHGMQAGALRRVVLGARTPPAFIAWAPTAVILSFIAVALLAVAKPF